MAVRLAEVRGSEDVVTFVRNRIHLVTSGRREALSDSMFPLASSNRIWTLFNLSAYVWYASVSLPDLPFWLFTMFDILLLLMKGFGSPVCYVNT